MDKLLTSAMQDYLKAVFELGGEAVSTQSLAHALGVAPASVSGMLKRLALLKLVEYEKYYGVSLTSSGRAIALETLRHHRLIETYLAEALGYSWHEVHDEAEKLEHVISEAFEDRIAEVLGHPTHDPHGDPIPQRDGSLPESPGRPLGEQELGQAVEVTRVASQDSEVLQYLDKHSLKPGAVVTVVGDEPFNGPLLLELGGKTLALGRDLAQKVHVKVVNGERG